MSHVSLIAKGPIKNVQRAAGRHGVNVNSCRAVGRDVQCYTSCKTEPAVMQWFQDRGRVKVGRGFPPGTLLYYSGHCGGRDLGRRRGKKRRK